MNPAVRVSELRRALARLAERTRLPMNPIFGHTHVGLVRRRNEDSLYVGQSLFAVADGLGGHVVGDIASAAIQALPPYDHAADPADLTATLGRAI